MRIKGSNSKPKQEPAVETRESIEAQVAAFLQSGGTIQEIAGGVSGQVWTGTRQLKLGKK
ncbi:MULTISPECIES: hypothetical protein [Pseudomonas]|jgi:hypothetical protein|uniref:Transcriptional regulator SutA RNAP-binding domain-containing protein n=1 Tax=Pseudomonas indica TaxID=137658 RepID=A0A1G9GYF5_9PSED|nr:MULTISPECIES: hypothetical protein [Pseudomonas]MBU3056791.1 hypothetical protein [Pseudomonas indica]PAU58418.1 hypothetical protein BZL41_18045 [Pseudomonas sp. PIC25]PAU60156.1 hypothetical protein BZL42_10720 [Pseudomonas indica]SDL05625.1 hypothetical protein SAMN05216186_11446 [Pseudomonas indica]